MSRLLSAALLTLVFMAGVSPTANAAPNCKAGKPCGDSCISQDKTCHAAAPATQCKTGKLCGGSCIAQNKTCSK
jgi:hypothetical protein